MSSALATFESRSDLEAFRPNGLLLFALELRFGIDDITTQAVTSLTDGSQDRKCDLIYLDVDSRTAVLAQAHYSNDPTKTEAPANKAADLVTAASWVLGNERPDQLGPNLRSAAEDLHNAILGGDVEAVELWYSHNLPESQNVRDEFEHASAAARAILKERYRELDIEVRFLEVGRTLLDEWYESTENPIFVTDTFDVPASSWFEEEGDGWRAVCTSVPAEWLHDLYQKYGDKLFSANVRGYMPSRRTAQNINYNMEQTARGQPGRFWAFNNGVTALVNSVRGNKRRKTLKVAGIAVVNGAQTTGALAKVKRASLGDARVLMRFVQPSDAGLVSDIIRFNNSQNPIKPSDFRSADRHQERLRKQFESIPNATYLGARRGGQGDRARRPSNLIPSDTVAQALAAFHQDPAVAYHDLRGIWERDDVYSQYFSEHTTASHIVYCYSLLRTIQTVKVQLAAKPAAAQTRDERDLLDYLSRRGSSFLLASAVSSCSEIYLNRAIPDSFALSFGNGTSPSTAVDNWAPLVDALLPFAHRHLSPVFDSGGLRRKDSVSAAIDSFRSVVASTRRANADVFKSFEDRVV